jgi:hypothetical protein
MTPLHVNMIALADFDPEADTLGILTWEGIYYVVGGSPVRWFNSGNEGVEETTISVFMRSVQSSPTGIVIPLSGNGGFSISTAAEGITCGNDVCDLGENTFSCPGDCYADNTTDITYESSTGAYCDIDSDCDSGNCVNNLCALKLQYEVCISDSQCLSGLCSNGKCSNPGFVATLTAAKNEQFGSGTNEGNFISLLFMIGLPLAVVFLIRQMWSLFLAIPVYFALAIFFTAIGWLSPVYLIVSLVVIIAVGAAGLAFSSFSGG